MRRETRDERREYFEITVMIKSLTFSILLIGMCLSMNAQEWKTPTIEGYGRIAEYEDAVIKPDPTKEYKVFFHITSNEEREGVNTSLWKIARLINLLENGGVPKENIHIGAVISGPASPIVLTESAHLKKMNKPNPNLDLLHKLSNYGVDIHFCGQAAAERNIDPHSELNPYTELTLSALTDIPTYQMLGYIIMF